MIADAFGILCGLMALAAIVAASPFVARLIGSSWPGPKYGISPIQRAVPSFQVYANLEEYARTVLGSAAFEDIMRHPSPTACNASAAACSSDTPTLESLTEMMEKFKPDPFARSPVYVSDGVAYRINMDMLNTPYLRSPFMLYGGI